MFLMQWISGKRNMSHRGKYEDDVKYTQSFVLYVAIGIQVTFFALIHYSWKQANIEEIDIFGIKRKIIKFNKNKLITEESVIRSKYKCEWSSYYKFQPTQQLLPVEHHMHKRVNDILTHIISENQDLPVLDGNINAYVCTCDIDSAQYDKKGYIVVHSGLFGQVSNDDELAMTIGHELAHSIFCHIEERTLVTDSLLLALNLTTMFYLLPVVVWGSSISFRIISRIGTLFCAVILSQFLFVLPLARKQEMEADTVGFKIMSRAGFCADRAITAFNKNSAIHDAYIEMMEKETNIGIQRWFMYLRLKYPQVISAHPNWKKRVENLEHIKKST